MSEHLRVRSLLFTMTNRDTTGLVGETLTSGRRLYRVGWTDVTIGVGSRSCKQKLKDTVDWTKPNRSLLYDRVMHVISV